MKDIWDLSTRGFGSSYPEGFPESARGFDSGGVGSGGLVQEAIPKVTSQEAHRQLLAESSHSVDSAMELTFTLCPLDPKP